MELSRSSDQLEKIFQKIFQSRLLRSRLASDPREGAIIKCPPNGLFHDLVTVIITPRTVISEMVNNDKDNDWPLVVQKCHYTLLK